MFNRLLSYFRSRHYQLSTQDKVGYPYSLGIVTTTAAPALNQFFKSYPLLQSILSLDIWFFCNWLKIIFGGDFYEQTLNDPQGRRVYSKLLSCCTANCPVHFGFLFFKVSLRTQTYFRLSLDSGDKRQPKIGLRSQATPRWDEEKKNKANLCKNSERLIIA